LRVIDKENEPGETPLANSQPDTGNFKALFEASFHAFFQPMHRYAYTLLRNNERASDVVQATFVKWWETGTEVNSLEDAKRYLYTAVYRNCLNVLRDDKVKLAQAVTFKLQQAAHVQHTDGIVIAELDHRIKSTINSLPEQCRRIFHMSRFEEKTYLTIATELGLSIKTVETQMGKALRVLREKLADYV
jgi:RNA polymerase sigma-70 factor (ECF subfamily)